MTWTLSVDHADQLLPGGFAQSCLAVAAMLDGHGVPASVFSAPAACAYIAGSSVPAGQAAERTRMALVVLEQAGLISIDRSTEPPIVRMSPILQRAVRVAMSPTMVEQSALAAAAALLESWPEGERGTWLGQSLRASAACLRRATGGLLWTNGLHPLLLRAGQSLDDASLTGPAVDYWTQLTSTGDQVFGAGHPDSMIAVERLASAYVAAGRVSEAVAWYQRIMADWGRAFGPDHPRTLAARVRLGRVLVTAGLYEDAIAVLTAALNDAERAYGPAHPECAIIRDEVAAGYRAAGELSEAIRLYRLILGERERSPGQSAPRHHADAPAAGRGLSRRRADQGGLLAVQEGRGGSPAQPGRRPSRHAARPRRARVGLPPGRPDGDGGADVRAGARVPGQGARRAIIPIRSSAALNLGRVYYAVGRLTDAGALLADTVARGERVLAPADPLTKAARESLAVIVGERAPSSRRRWQLHPVIRAPRWLGEISARWRAADPLLPEPQTLRARRRLRRDVFTLPGADGLPAGGRRLRALARRSRTRWS